ncbi:hypothetical protein BEWA_051130 (apicoplast) [Theileria equi strain WA]|uniref:Uncharacterized protein n=1 Tax=Theileria equi strain WA TaxID=1537102 RepID=L1L9Y1_THEEQ|nr:hypothetical protein BEWA_051130 [Theileria equi strain WA]EKX71963.1 hypothetical protein BEWA_051130 [Theileria equi strain WA]|eukprot:XP_025033556.1 hypothetical protein BEWA_051130 (apicoplast) [Theileria equi strain WA]
MIKPYMTGLKGSMGYLGRTCWVLESIILVGQLLFLVLVYLCPRPDNNYVANLQGVDESIVYKGLIHDKFVLYSGFF